MPTKAMATHDRAHDGAEARESRQDFLVLENITKSYGGGKVLDNLSFTLAKGECLSLLGPSGCGKSTCLNIIAGLLDPDSGEVYLDGAKLTTVPVERRNLGVVFQSYALFPHLTVSENVEFGLRIRRVAGDARRERVMRTLEAVGLAEFGDRYPQQLSGGQQQRVALARALAIEPPVLLLDEPLSNLDAKLRTETALELLAIRKRLGTTTVFVTHDQKEAMLLGDRVAILNKGKVEQIGSPREIYEAPASLFVANFIGENNTIECLTSEVVGRLRFAGIGGEDEFIEPSQGVDVSGSPGTKYLALIRPEATRLSRERRSDANSVRAVVRQVLYLGENTVVRLQKDDFEIRALFRSLDRAADWAIGDEAYVSWDKDKMIVISGEQR